MPRTTVVPTTLVAGALVALALCQTACGTPGAQPGAGRALSLSPANVAPSTAYAVSGDDFMRVSDAPNALAAIERLRPLFLRPRPSYGAARGQAPVISVFVNGAYSGGLDVLRLITPSAVASARFLQPAEAITTIGARYAADGVIMVQLRGFAR